ncbi:MAG: hypothetical protein E7408_01145 [Ruminococcaceae bacterium]|nr:hypothetical protein [Oscillospiraceae bacterium]
MKQQKPKTKISKEERERIDNKVVLATAIALVSAMLMLFLYNWFVSIYASQTRTLIQILQWAGVAGVALFVILFFVKKDRKYLFVIPYCAVGSLFMQEILRGTVIGWILKLFGKSYATTAMRFNFIYICLAVYLVASYIYYGIKLHKAAK